MNKQSKSKLALIHFLLGSDNYQKETYIKTLLKNNPNLDVNFSVQKFDLKEQLLSEVFSQARTFPFGSSQQVFIVRLSKKLTVADKKLLGSFLEEPPAFTHIIFDIIDDAFDSKGVKGNSYCKVFDSNVGSDDVRSIILSRIKQAGKSITNEALRLLLKQYPGDSDWIINYLDYLLLYIGDRPEVNEGDVKTIVPETISYGSFDLVNALISRQFDRVLEIFRDSVEHGHSIHDVMGLIHWQLRRVYEAKLKLLAGENPQVIGKELRIGSFFLNNFLKDVNRFDLLQIEKALEELASLDDSIKTGKVTGSMAIEKYFVEMAV